MTPILTTRLQILLQSAEDVQRMLASLPEEYRLQISPVWLAQLAAAERPSPWVHGFTLRHRATGLTVGSAGFKGPPDLQGMVEIAYQIALGHQGQGLATEAGRVLVEYAFSQPDVITIRAHTALESNASARVLEKCGFRKLGQVIDPEDGPVWCWEQTRDSAQTVRL